MAAHSTILAWQIPQTKGTGGLQSMGSQTVRHNLAQQLNHNISVEKVPVALQELGFGALKRTELSAILVRSAGHSHVGTTQQRLFHSLSSELISLFGEGSQTLNCALTWYLKYLLNSYYEQCTHAWHWKIEQGVLATAKLTTSPKVIFSISSKDQQEVWEIISEFSTQKCRLGFNRKLDIPSQIPAHSNSEFTHMFSL